MAVPYISLPLIMLHLNGEITSDLQLMHASSANNQQTLTMVHHDSFQPHSTYTPYDAMYDVHLLTYHTRVTSQLWHTVQMTRLSLHSTSGSPKPTNAV